MGFKALLMLSILSYVAAQTDFYKVCIPLSQQTLCNVLSKDDSRVTCESVESRVDCALKLARGTADIGVFSEEEVLLLGQQQPNDHAVVASITNTARDGPYAFEAVAVVSTAHTGGLEGLRGGKYCHPGLDEPDLRWSPRVLRDLEKKAVRTDRCTESQTAGKTVGELEVEALNEFFSAACRPGEWSPNATIDANLKRDFPNMCSLCGTGTTNNCNGYSYDMGVAVSGVSNDNRHIQALECLTRNGNNAVSFVAWQHVREFFTIRSSQLATSYALLCEDGTTRPLTAEILAATSSPCSLVKQPWGAILTTTSRGSAVLNDLRTWWPNGLNPGGNTWQATLFEVLVGGTELKATFHDTLPKPANYTSVRALTDIDATTACMPARRWCTTSTQEHNKCLWVRRAAYTLGLEPAISCQQRSGVFQCMEDIRDNRADVISVDSNYGYLARQHYSLSPVKLLQNSRNNANALSRVIALVKESSTTTISRFENLKGAKACFPEFGGIAYVTFVRAAHERSVISSASCDYAEVVGEFFGGACAPGAVDAAHALSDAISSYNATNLCSTCQSAVASTTTVAVANASSAYTCAYDWTNKYFGNNGTLACLADANSDVAFVETQNIAAHLTALNLQASQFRVLCRNNTLALTTGVAVDDNCLLSLVVDGEVLSRRNDPQYNSLSTLLDSLDATFGYTASVPNQLINLEIYSPFDSTSDLLFKDSAVGLSEPSITTTHEAARNYFELFSHLETCTGAAAGLSNGVTPLLSLLVAAFVLRWAL